MLRQLRATTEPGPGHAGVAAFASHRMARGEPIPTHSQSPDTPTPGQTTALAPALVERIGERNSEGPDEERIEGGPLGSC